MLIIDQLSRGRWIWLVTGGAVAAASVFAGCSGGFDSCTADKNCGPLSGGGGATGSAGNAGHGGSGASAGQSGASGHGGSGSGAGGVSGMAGEAGAAGAAGMGGGVPCDTTKSPTTESCLVADAYGVFVAPTGDDVNVGSMLEPVKTISKAIELAQADGKFVVACDGTYDEQLKLTAGTTLYGGFACPSTAAPWSYEAGKKAKVAPSTRGIALSIAANASAVVIEDFEFDAKDGIDPGESSIAAFVNTSSSVALTRVKLVAGKGVDGANGAVTAVTFPLQSMLNGNSATADAGGLANVVVCPVGGSTRGGKGGDGGSVAVGPGSNGAPDLGAGKGGTQGSGCNSGGGGGDGTSAATQPASPGAAKLGSITPTGWSSTSGADGAAGTPGQGGGGGTGADTGGGGGGGGAGGCGGAGGTGGKAGGSSIALLVLSSTVTLTANELVAADAGKGGAGIAGQIGQTPGGNAGAFTGGGCGGGKGGKGGAGGASGGGAGGISVGIAWTGTTAMDPTPTLMMMTKITTGALGAKGVGGVPVTGDGIDGVKQDVLKVL